MDARGCKTRWVMGNRGCPKRQVKEATGRPQKLLPPVPYDAYLSFSEKKHEKWRKAYPIIESRQKEIT